MNWQKHVNVFHEAVSQITFQQQHYCHQRTYQSVDNDTNPQEKQQGKELKYQNLKKTHKQILVSDRINFVYKNSV